MKAYSKGDEMLNVRVRLEASISLASKQPAPLVWAQSYPVWLDFYSFFFFFLTFSSNNTDGLERSQNILPEHLQTLDLEARGAGWCQLSAGVMDGSAAAAAGFAGARGRAWR